LRHILHVKSIREFGLTLDWASRSAESFC